MLAASNWSHADMGNIQLMDNRRVLVIAAQRGFKQDFLDFFREVSTEDKTACGRALRPGDRIVVEDVEADGSTPQCGGGSCRRISWGAVDAVNRTRWQPTRHDLDTLVVGSSPKRAGSVGG